MTTPFVPVGPGGNFHHNAVLEYDEDDVALGLGFASAADALIEHWQEHGPNDGHLMPILTLYRHGLELLLKGAIREAAACLRRDGDSDSALVRETLDDWLARHAGHSLQSLATRLDTYLERLRLDGLPVETHEVLLTLHKLDPGGDTFRYATTWDKSERRYASAPRPDSTHIDVVAMGEHFTSAANLIGGGVLSVLELYREYQAELAQDAGF